MKKCSCLVMAAALALILPTAETKAEESRGKSRGELGEQIQLYAQDIQYLQAEMDQLWRECGKEYE